MVDGPQLVYPLDADVMPVLVVIGVCDLRLREVERWWTSQVLLASASTTSVLGVRISYCPYTVSYK